MAKPTEPAEPAAAVAAPLDLLLTRSPLGARSRGLSAGTAFRFGRALARRPRRALARAAL